jgi:benzoylformate decarboxylase
MSPRGRTGGQSVLETLLAWGIRRVFTCPGSTEAAFLDATVDHPEFDVVLTPHESVAVSAADGYARATGEPAVAYLHTHVGLTNALSHLYAARLARSPLVVLTGLKPALIQAHGGFTAIPDTGRLAEPFVKASWQSLTTEAIPEDLNRSIRLALTEPCGPTWLGLSQDLMNEECPVPVADPARYRPRARTAPDPDRLAAAAELLDRAARPVLVAGAEVARHGAVAELVELAERLDVPVVNEDRRTYERPGFPSSHDAYAGLYDVRRSFIRESDLIMFVGCHCFTEFDVPAQPEIPEAASVVHIHTDAAEIGAIYGFDVDIVGDERLTLARLLSRLEGREGARGGRAAAARAEYLADPGVTPPVRDDVENVGAVASALAELVTDRTTVVGEATTTNGVLLRRLPQHPPHQYYTSASGSLGWGLGAALGIKLALPEREVMVVAGDGAFQFGPQALWVAAHYQIPVIFVVVNNESYAAVTAALRRHGGRAVEQGKFPGTDLSGIDTVSIARGYGVFAQRIDRASGLAEAMEKARAHPGPSLIEVMTDPSYSGP